MASDRARITFDPTRQYRSVIAQQGRVTLEADNNEATSIASEALRLETIDVIGPTGAPGTGYNVISGPGAGLVGIAPGVFYLGGWRLELDPPGIPNLAQQPDWHDAAALPPVAGNAVIALLVSEQSVSATEDQALREVALGGPDTAARTRLMQHFLQIGMTGTDCAAGAAAVNAALTADGVTIDPNTLQLNSSATLQAGFVPGPASTDPCTPVAAGGYLGSDNQMVRVTVIGFNPATNTGTLLWGWNNASILYRATWINAQTLALSPPPVDQEHAPQQNQAVEILRSAADLGNGNAIAQPQGFVTALQLGYTADSGQIMLTDALQGTSYQNDTTPLFVRLWQATVPFTSGQPATLDNVSGLTVTITMTAMPGMIALNPFWHFAVRPSMPLQIYPRRYHDAAQPPDGPRQWIADLGVVTATANGVTPSDCRVPFLPLTELKSCECCELVLDPAANWLGQLNAALASNATALSICFLPGQFNIASTIRFSGKSVKLTGAGYSTRLVGAALEVVLELDQCPDVVLCDLSVQASAAGYSRAQGTYGLQGAITIRGCNQVDIERVSLTCADAELRSASCLAVYNSVPPAGAAPQLYNVRVLNSRFNVGHCQVGILLVNADRAQVEGNVVVTPPTPRRVTLGNITAHPFVVAALRKQLLSGLTITDSAPPTTTRAIARARKRARKVAAGVALREATRTEAPAAQTATPASAHVAAALVAPRINLGEVGRAHVRATFGTLTLQFISSDRLGNAWTDALRAAGVTANSTMGQVHTTVKQIATTALKTPAIAAPGFRNWLASVLPLLYSTSGQGIVVGGNLANDIRILNNTIDGTVQGIHVGLSDMKANPAQSHLQAHRVQVSGNTVNIRITAETTGDRHGIFVGGVSSALIDGNHLELTREPNAGQDIYGIKVAGSFGARLLLERNRTLNFTAGTVTMPDVTSVPRGSLWKASDNVSSSANFFGLFRQTDNIP